MEIAFFSDSYLPNRDGVAVEVHALARALRRLGHGVTVLAPHRRIGVRSTDEELDGIRVIRSRALPVPIYDEYRWPLFPFALTAGRRLGDSVDVVHVHTPGMMGTTGFLAARHWRRPLVGTFHTDVWAARGSFGRGPVMRAIFRIVRWYTAGVYYRCDQATAPTAWAARSLTESGTKPFRRPVEVVPNGIETDRFRPGIGVPDWKARFGFDEAPMLTYLGRLTADKGVRRFLDALSALPASEPWTAAVAGVGPDEPVVRQRIAGDSKLRGRVRFVGPVAEEEKPALLSQSGLFVLPSIADTASVAVLEAMASGVACVVSDVGGPAAIVRDGETGRVVDVGRPGPLAACLTELIERPEERKRLGANGLGWVRSEASIDGTARRFISLYRHLLSEGDRAVAARGA